MRRPRPIGTWGKITITKKGPNKFVAYARYRDATGKLRPMERTGATKSEAEDTLKADMAAAIKSAGSATLDRYSRLEKVTRSWIQELREKVAESELRASTIRAYISWAENWVIPKIGSLVPGNHELSMAVCEGFVKNVRKQTSLDGAESARTVLSLIARHAMKHGLIDQNPVREVTLKKQPGDDKEIRAMTLAQRTEMLAKLRVFCAKKQTDSLGRSIGERGKVWRDLPDIAEAMLSTGARIGEIVCIHSTNVFPATGEPGRKVELTHHLERIQGKGLVRQPGRKGGEPAVTKFVPSWSVPMWRRRKLAAGNGMIFSSWTGGLLDAENLSHRLREALDACGFDWVTSHVWRKTHAAVLKEAGFTNEEIANELGNTEGVAKKHYIPPTTGTAAAAVALEAMFAAAEDPPEDSPDKSAE